MKNWLTNLADDCMGEAVGASTGEQVASQLPGRTNGPADAYRHLLWSAELTRKYGKAIAEPLLRGHEDGQAGAETAMDSYNNEIGVSVGNYVRNNKGTWEDIKQLTQEVMYISLFGYTPTDITGSNWYSLPEGNLVLAKNNMISLSSGLSVPSISLTNVDTWSKNPKDSVTGEELTNEQSNWPSNGWQSRFIYEQGNKAVDYTGPIEPFSLYCKGSASLKGVSWGDPHLVTSDGLKYDFQQRGEYVLLDSPGDGYQLQVRQEKWDKNPKVSVNTALATELNGTKTINSLYL